MEHLVMKGYFVISVVFALFDLAFVKICHDKNDPTAHLLGITAFFGAAVDLTYLVSILIRDYFWMSVFTSAYFICIDWMLLGMVAFVFAFTRMEFTEFWRNFQKGLIGWALLETVVFAINPFREISIGYVHNGEIYASYNYVMKPLYLVHLVFTYGLIVFALCCLILRGVQKPKQYRRQYRYMIEGILTIVAVNAVFLYAPVGEMTVHLDYSICGYSLVLMVMYWSSFEYTRRELQKGLSLEIFENIGQGIVLFDYDGFLAMKNNRAEELLAGVSFRDRMTVTEFLNQFNFPARAKPRNMPFSVQCYLGDSGSAVRCDFRLLRDEKGILLGELYVFTDSDLETDLLTGFQKWKSFLKDAGENPIRRKVSVALFDINELGEINAREGVDEGDRQIRLLASAMRKCLPAETRFVRGQDAVLIAICHDFDADMMLQYAENVKNAYERSIQYAVCEAEEDFTNPSTLVDDAMHGLLVKKLLDSGSNHSQTLTSLVRALQECDSDTEAHVQRTQNMGRELGKRIGLSDCEQSDLSLLCLLHDIGKIGIPLDILNKPFKLTPDEWTLIRSHVEKGYQIAKSSDKLSYIAEMILHHHERWDGKGYPDGLSRESIPLLSRIISVVDAFDAMTNDRPYHKAISINAALEEIRRCAGTQFDPFISSEFIRMIRERYGASLPSVEKSPEQTATKAMDLKKTMDKAAEANVYPVRFSQYMLDEQDRIVEADACFREITGYDEEDWKDGGLSQFDLVPPTVRVEYAALVASQLASSTTVFLEHKLRRKDGRELFVYCYSEKIFVHTIKERRTKIVITDISTSYAARLLSLAESDKSEKRLRYWEEIYRRDAMTSLLNHIAFQNDVDQRMLKENGQILLMMIDVDFFKGYNDTFGHDAGDRLLMEIARTMKDVTGAADLCCRMGGDEFAVAISPEPNTSREELRGRAERVYTELTRTVRAIRPEWGISAGAAVSDGESGCFKELYRLADQALFQAKRDGRGRLVWRENMTEDQIAEAAPV